MIKTSIGEYNQPEIEVTTTDGGSISMSYFKAEDTSSGRPTMNFHSFNGRGLGYSASMVEGEKRREYQKETYIMHINKTVWISAEEKRALIDFINQYLN